MSNNQQTLLDQIEADILINNVCPELASQATQLVFGSGNPDTDIVFIGEAPGKNEDLQGQPFVGASGRLLDEMLGSINLGRGDIYITNIVKYRPPNNRDPSKAEIEAFWPYLVRQLDVIQPKAVVTLGRHSMNKFLPKHKIGEVHGQPEEVDIGNRRIVIVPLYHPAYALYNGSLRQTLMEDFAKLPDILKEIK